MCRMSFAIVGKELILEYSKHVVGERVAQRLFAISL